MNTPNDAHWMGLALRQAQLAAEAQEVPIGAVVVHQGQVVAQAHNAPIAGRDPTAHAEVLALRQAAQHLDNYRLAECTLYVTVEPCLMCAGAIAQARIGRLVYGCEEPRTGAIQSVVRSFELPGLNPHTQVLAGVGAEPSRALLQAFFRERRQAHREAPHAPLPDFALRTPESAFEGLPDFPWIPHYRQDLPSLQGLRLAHLDEGPESAPITWLLLHSSPSWSYAWRQVIPVLLAAGHRVVAPDLIGFGRSDKPKKPQWHQFQTHCNILLEWVQALDLQRVVLGVQDGAERLGQTLLLASPARYRGLWDTTLTPLEAQANDAPFPDDGHRAATRAFPSLVLEPTDPAGPPSVGHWVTDAGSSSAIAMAEAALAHFSSPH